MYAKVKKNEDRNFITVCVTLDGMSLEALDRMSRCDDRSRSAEVRALIMADYRRRFVTEA